MPVWKTRLPTQLRTPQTSTREFLTSDGYVHDKDTNDQNNQSKLRNQTVSLIYGSSNSNFNNCIVRNLELKKVGRNIIVSWEKPDIKTRNGYFIERYTIRFR